MVIEIFWLNSIKRPFVSCPTRVMVCYQTDNGHSRPALTSFVSSYSPVSSSAGPPSEKQPPRCTRSSGSIRTRLARKKRWRHTALALCFWLPSVRPLAFTTLSACLSTANHDYRFHLHAGLHWRPREFRSTPRRSTGRPAGGLDAITRWRGNGGDSLSRPGSESACGRVTHQGTRPQPISYEKGATDELSKWGEQFWNIV